jgi:hypothetical protein
MAIDPFMPDAGAHFGFAGAAGGAHLARSYMLEELQTLFAHVQEPDAPKRRYQAAVVDANCLGKQSGQTRKLTYRHLRELYALDPAVPIFQALRTFWDRDPDAQPLLALCCACARDSLLRASVPMVLSTPADTLLPRAPQWKNF